MASILGIRSERSLRKGEFSYSLASCCVCSFLPHANVEPKHGFSINKSLLSVHGYSTNDETILALVKDFIIERGGIEKSKVTQNLLRSCGAFLEQQRKVEEQMKLTRVKEELAKQTKDVVQELENEIQFLKKGVEVAEASTEEGNQESGEVMRGKTSNRDNMVLCQRKIAMELKRKTESSEDLRKLEEKKTKLCTQQTLLYFFLITFFHDYMPFWSH